MGMMECYELMQEPMQNRKTIYLEISTLNNLNPFPIPTNKVKAMRIKRRPYFLFLPSCFCGIFILIDLIQCVDVTINSIHK